CVLGRAGGKGVNAQYELVGRDAVTLDDIKHFRQIGSHAPGHPEYHLVSGVETTTGPLGQGIATSVGMAIAQKHPAARGGGAPHRAWGCRPHNSPRRAATTSRTSPSSITTSTRPAATA